MQTNGFHTRLVNALAAALEDDSEARMTRFRDEMRSIIPKQEAPSEDVMSDRELGDAFCAAMDKH